MNLKNIIKNDSKVKILDEQKNRSIFERSRVHSAI